MISVGFSSERLAHVDGRMQAELDAGHNYGIGLMVARYGGLFRFGYYERKFRPVAGGRHLPCRFYDQDNYCFARG